MQTANSDAAVRITVLDGFTANPGDLSWGALESLGKLTVYDRTAPNELLARAADATVLLTNKTLLKEDALAQLPKLRFIGVLATGYNVVDVAAARKMGVAVSNVPGYSTDSVAQLVFAHLLHLCNHVAHHAATVREGKWAASRDFAYWDFPLTELSGLTLGIVGFGNIGRAVGQIGRALGMNILACNPSPLRQNACQAKQVDLETLFRQSDAVTLHCPLKEENRGFVNTALLAQMKPTAFLINTARGPLVDESALADALNRGAIAGAGLDVLSREPPHADNPLLTARNCHITPHIAWATGAARRRLLQVTAENVAAFLHGAPKNVVN